MGESVGRRGIPRSRDGVGKGSVKGFFLRQRALGSVIAVPRVGVPFAITTTTLTTTGSTCPGLRVPRPGYRGEIDRFAFRVP